MHVPNDFYPDDVLEVIRAKGIDLSQDVLGEIKAQRDAREEFDEFFRDFIRRHKLHAEMYRAVSYLMSTYISMHELHE